MEGGTVIALEGLALVSSAMILLSIAAKALQVVFKRGIETVQEPEVPVAEEVEAPSTAQDEEEVEEPAGVGDGDGGVETEVVAAITSALHLYGAEAYGAPAAVAPGGRGDYSPWAVAGRMRLLQREPRR